MSKLNFKQPWQPPRKVVNPGDSPVQNKSISKRLWPGKIELSAMAPLSFTRRESRWSRPRKVTNSMGMPGKASRSLDFQASLHVVTQDKCAKKLNDLKILRMRREMDQLAQSIGLVDLQNKGHGSSMAQNAQNHSSGSPETHEQAGNVNDAMVAGNGKRRGIVKPMFVPNEVCHRESRIEPEY